MSHNVQAQKSALNATEAMIESGEKFGKYTLLERLAVGGMAEIFKASAGGLDGFEKIVAIKRLHRQYSEDEEFATMLVDEAKLAVRLNHANIGQIFDLGSIDGQYFIVMEYIDGLDMHELAVRAESQNRSLPLEAVVYVTAEVAEALHFAHTRLGPDGKPLEVVHRDVSPQNIMVSAEGEVKLVDFGIAKARMRAQHTKAGIIKGKFYYMSPEQAMGHRIDARTDVYALGMVLYEILSGSHPFDRVPDGELLKSVRTADFAPIRHIMPALPEGLASIIDRALMRNADHRFASALELKQALKGLSRELGSFGRMELSELVRKYSSSHLPEETRAADFEAMDRAQYAAGHHSVIFDVAAAEADFEDDEQTRVFLRDHEEKEPAIDDLDEDGRTSLLGWAHPQEVEAGDQPDEGRPEAGVSDGIFSSAPPEPAWSPDENKGGQRADETPVRHRRLRQRLRRGMATQFDHLLRRRPHLVGAALAGLAVIILAVAAFVLFGTDPPSEAEERQSWHASIAEESGSAGIAPKGEVSEVSLAVSTTPANAELYIDDNYAGNTPASLDRLEVGRSYLLRFEKDEFDTREISVIVEPEMAPMVVRLEPLGGIVQVDSKPEGIEIYVDGELQGRTPVTVMGLERDLSYEIEARRSADDSQMRMMRWAEGETRLQHVHFEFEGAGDEGAEASEEQAAAAEASPRRQRSERRRSSRRQASAAPSRSSSSSSSSPSLVLSRNGAESDSGKSSLNVWDLAGDEDTGRLNVRVNAEQGRIYVDDELIQDGTVLIGHSLSAGNYEVKVYFPTLKRYSEARNVEIRAGETSTETFRP